MDDIIEIEQKQEILNRMRRRINSSSMLQSSALLGNSIILLLDVSGSMSGRKIDDAKEALIHFLSNINLSESEVGLISFGDNVQTFNLSRNLKYLRTSIKSFSADGYTPMKEAITSTQEVLKGKTNPVMVIATDGEPTDASKESILNYAALLKNRGIRIIVIGIGDDIDVNFLRRLATSANDYHFAKVSFELKKIYKQVADTLALPPSNKKEPGLPKQ
jgi:molecular chaperone DnaK